MTKKSRDDNLPPAAPEALQGLGLTEDQIAGVKKYVWARLRLGGALRSGVIGCVIVASASLLLPQFLDSDSHAAYRSLVDVALADYLPYVQLGILCVSLGMLALVGHQLRALDRVLATGLGLSERASAHVRRIARFGTLREAFGERVARLVVYGVVREGPTA